MMRVVGHPLAIPMAAVMLAFAFGGVLILALDVPLAHAGTAFLQGAFGSPYVISVSLNRAVVLAMVGLGFVFAARAGLTNVGGEGQIAMGGIAATATALLPFVAALPLGLAFIVPMCAAMCAGAFWGGLAGILKVKAGTNEVISTLLLSFIGVWLVYWAVQSEALLRQPMTTGATLPESLPIPITTQLPLLTGSYASPVTIGTPLTLGLAVLFGIVLLRGVVGFRMRMLGLNPVAAARAGVRTDGLTILALCVAGAMGGLAGAMMLQGDQYSLKAGFTSGYGFDGLVVGLLARGSILGVLAGALLFGFLRSGGITMEMSAGVPSAIVQIVQGLTVVLLAAAALFQDKRTDA